MSSDEEAVSSNDDPLTALSGKANLKQLQSILSDFANDSSTSESAAEASARAAKLLQQTLDKDRLTQLIQQEKSLKKLRTVFAEAARVEGDAVQKTLAIFDRLDEEERREAAAKTTGQKARPGNAPELVRAQTMGDDYAEGVKPRLIEIKSVEISQIAKIDDVEQRFNAQIFVEFQFAGGKQDPDLWNDSGEDFPIGADGRPTFKPTAKWYFERIELCNHIAGTAEKLEGNIYTHKDNVCYNVRWSADFFEELELANFPFDFQNLTIEFRCNVRKSSKMPCEFAISPRLKTCGVVPTGFQVRNKWKLLGRTADGLATPVDGRRDDEPGHIHVVCDWWGLGDRMRPAVKFVATVYRRPAFYVVNVMVPMFCFATLPFFQWPVDTEAVHDRMSITLTLLLTGAAYKYAVASMTPSISCAYMPSLKRTLHTAASRNDPPLTRPG